MWIVVHVGQRSAALEVAATDMKLYLVIAFQNSLLSFNSCVSMEKGGWMPGRHLQKPRHPVKEVHAIDVVNELLRHRLINFSNKVVSIVVNVRPFGMFPSILGKLAQPMLCNNGILPFG